MKAKTLMATLTPSFEEFLSTLPNDKCQQALVWFSMNSSQFDPLESEVLQTTLSQLEQMNSFDTLALVAHLSPSDQVAYTMMNEFGANIRHKSFFDTLVSRVQKRLQELNTIHQLTNYSNN